MINNEFCVIIRYTAIAVNHDRLLEWRLSARSGHLAFHPIVDLRERAPKSVSLRHGQPHRHNDRTVRIDIKTQQVRLIARTCAKGTNQ